ncbi:hypothetical protein BC939DRAFT_500868 [Gamsiella multidivaricata]|uniref:uncharacterized protein n=1 Tax=Gamsiella multidivaricata TaxID=101098 RepID=UPI00221FADCD|nr:uncharacterized protein BC939DRAFT_500868 [Gamsiella multidivaricata]KAG0371045.1 hypothetical protein BGZ54_000963 [Gamsiella multidivaricata]KAI7828208.1 hypothetical protein BC939DRAFT_500868 [Gamsiella multidivaricata]
MKFTAPKPNHDYFVNHDFKMWSYFGFCENAMKSPTDEPPITILDQANAVWRTSLERLLGSGVPDAVKARVKLLLSKNYDQKFGRGSHSIVLPDEAVANIDKQHEIATEAADKGEGPLADYNTATNSNRRAGLDASVVEDLQQEVRRCQVKCDYGIDWDEATVLKQQTEARDIQKLLGE